MKPDRLSPASPPPAAFADGLGVRVRLAEKGGDELEVLRLAPEFVAVPAFEFALRERVGRLANFRHAYYSRVRRVDRLDGGSVLGIVSEHATGARLSHVLDIAVHHKLDLDINAALCLVRQLVPAIAMLHQNARDVAHGALAPERILVTPHARIVIADYVLGSAIDQLRLSRERLWRDLRIAVPPGAGTPRLDHRSDVMQIGVVALSLVLGRPLERDELRAAPDLVGTATEMTVLGDRAPISPSLRRWLLRTLQADPRGSFESAAEAQQGLEDVLSGEGGYIAAPVALEAFLTQYQECAVLGLLDKAAVSDEATAAGARDHKAPVAPVKVSTPVVAAPPPAAAPVVSPPQAPPSVPAVVAPEASVRPTAQPSSFVVQPFADTPQQAPASPPRSGRHRAVAADADPVAVAQHELSREVAAAHVAEHMFGVTEAGPAAAVRTDAVQDDRPSVWRRVQHAALVIAIAVALAEGVFIKWALMRDDSLLGGTGALSVESRPSGVPVVIDGESRGTTPLTVKLKEGAHVLELRASDRSRVLPVTIKSGQALAQYVELPSVEMTGTLEVRESPGARVLVDGQPRGTSPLKISDLTPGSHDIVIEGRNTRARQTVQVQAGVTTTLGSPAPAPSAAKAASEGGTGWITVTTPYEMQVFESGRLLGTTASDRLSLPAGNHEIEVVSDTLAFRTARSVTVIAGQTSTVAIDLPKGTLVLESDPPADVLVDGVKVGTTPIASLAVTIGPHEITFSHPELGQQHQAVSVTAGAPVKLSVKLQPAQ